MDQLLQTCHTQHHLNQMIQQDACALFEGENSNKLWKSQTQKYSHLVSQRCRSCSPQLTLPS